MNISGIYQIVNKVNKKVYIGSSANISKRWQRHLYELRANRHHNIILQRAWAKYGEKAFEFTVLEQTDDLFNRELFFINTLKPVYNIGSVSGGDNVSKHPNLAAIKQKHSDNLKGRWKNKGFRKRQMQRLSGAANPNWRGGSSKKTCRDCQKSISFSAELCLKCSKKGENNSFFGKHHSEATRAKLSIFHKGKSLSDSTKEKLRQISLKLHKDPEFVKKTDKARKRGKDHPLFGKERTSEVKEAVSAANKEKWHNLDYNLKRISRGLSVAIFAEGRLFLSKKSASNFYNVEECSIRFRCKSDNAKWASFQFVDYEFVKSNLDKLAYQYL